ncbi:MAG: hypothetical protein AMJ79_09045 [Phycisphaerae bacterium SM23_30]|nr:MAG: hypothetical protein AMJ79_09045 [Phycisphaerae bacterium SM23_30]
MRQLQTVITMMCVVTILSGTTNYLAAQDAPPTDPQEQVIQITKPDAEGVIAALPFKGDITLYLKLLSEAHHKNIIPSPQVRGAISINLFDVTFKEALDAVLPVNGFAYEEKDSFIYVYTKREFEELKAADRKMETRTFRLNYIPARDVETMIAPLLSSGAGVTTSPETGAAQAGTGEEWAGSKYIVIRDYPEQLQQIAALIQELDRKPPQVMVEATILVASLDDTNRLGVNFNVLAGVDFESEMGVITRPSDGYNTITVGGQQQQGGTGGTTTTAGVALSGTAVGAAFGGSGLNIGVIKSNIGLFIDALEETTDVVTLGNPKVLTLNRQLGELIVGDEIGYISSAESTQVSTTSTVTFLKTGVQLTFRPFVMDDGYVRMELNPEDSDGGLSASDLPFKKTTEVTTNVLVKDGNTIVVGGLFRDKTTLGHSQIPLLGNIPLLGHLFRSTIDNTRKEEVIFLITPHIVKEETDYAAAEAVLENCDLLITGIRQGLLGYSRERLSAAHYHSAKEHQAAGRLDKALWDARLAAYLTPTFLDALRLQDELRGEQIYQGEFSNMRLFMRRLAENDK